MRWFNLLPIAGVAAALCGRAVAQLPVDPLARAETRLGPGYVLLLNVTLRLIEEKELCGRFTLDSEGRIELTVGFRPVDKIALKGLTCAEAEKRIVAAIGKYYVVDPDVHVSIAAIPRIRVFIEGASFRNGPLTLIERSRLSDALREAGYQPGADLHNVHVARVEKDGSRVTLNADFQKVIEGTGDDAHNDPVLQNGDRIRLALAPVAPVQQTIAVHGEVGSPGFYPFQSGMTVRDALRAARDMRPSADVSRVTISRARNSTFMTVNGARAVEAVPTDDLKLEPDDSIYVATKDTGKRYAIAGAVPSPGSFDFTGPVTLTDAIQQAGGFKPSADRGKLLLLRGMLSDPSKAQTVEVNYDKISRHEMPEVTLDSGDLVEVPERKKPTLPIAEIGAWLLRLLVF